MAQEEPKEVSNEKATWLAVAGKAILATLAVAFLFAAAVRELSGSIEPVAMKVKQPSDVLFYLLAAGTMVSAGGVAFARNIIYAALSLLGTLLGGAALYIYLSADYLAVTQLLIYVGGVLVLILFAVMLTQRIDNAEGSNPVVGLWPGLVLLGVLLGAMTFVAVRTPWVEKSPVAVASTADRIGDLFLGHYLIAFEVISLLLLATLIGAVVVARKEIKE